MDNALLAVVIGGFITVIGNVIVALIGYKKDIEITRIQAKQNPENASSKEDRGEKKSAISAIKSRIGQKIFWFTTIGVMVIVGVVFYAFKNDKPTNEQFHYQVQVFAEDTQQPIHNAKVILEIEGVTPKTEYTDNNGIARFSHEQTIDGETVELTVEVKGYEPYEEYTDVTTKELPNEILLKAINP